MATHSNILAWEIQWTDEPDRLNPWGHKESDTTERLSLFFFQNSFQTLVSSRLSDDNSNCKVSYPIHGVPRWLSGKEPTSQCRRHGFNPCIRKIPWRRKWQPIPVLLPGKSHRQTSLVGYGPQHGKRAGYGLVTKQQQQHLTHTLFQ